MQVFLAVRSTISSKLVPRTVTWRRTDLNETCGKVFEVRLQVTSICEAEALVQERTCEAVEVLLRDAALRGRKALGDCDVCNADCEQSDESQRIKSPRSGTSSQVNLRRLRFVDERYYPSVWMRREKQ